MYNQRGAMRYFLGLFIISLFSVNTLAFSQCLPANNLRFSASDKSITSLSQEQYNWALNMVEETFSPIISELMGKKLIFKKEWENDRVNAHATRDSENNPVVVILGGMARHPFMTVDGLLAVACHELGHHLGGAPKAFRGRSTKVSWSSTEGQADYFATSKCLPLLFGNLKSNSFTLLEAYNSVDVKKAQEQCQQDDICTRVALASLSAAQVYASVEMGQFPALDKKDATVVSKTNYNRPNVQCRLDTYLAGARCQVDPLIPFDNQNPSVGACTWHSLGVQDPRGARPRCWFSPEDFK